MRVSGPDEPELLTIKAAAEVVTAFLQLVDADVSGSIVVAATNHVELPRAARSVACLSRLLGAASPEPQAHLAPGRGRRIDPEGHLWRFMQRLER